MNFTFDSLTRAFKKTLYLILSLVLITSSLMFSVNKAYANEIFEAPNKDIEEDVLNPDGGVVDIRSSDFSSMPQLASWLRNQESFITSRNVNGNYSYYFNTPNLQLSIYNSLQQLNSGGWMFGQEDPDSLIPQDESTWKTALMKYGYNIPSAVYLGEMPAPTLDVTNIARGVANPITAATIVFTGVTNWVIDISNTLTSALGGLFGIQTEDTSHISVDLANASFDDIKGIHYNLSDYIDSTEDIDKAVGQWLEDHWNQMKNDSKYDVHIETASGKSLFDEGEIIYKGEKVGDDVKGDEILSRLIAKVGLNYIMLINQWVEIGTNQDGWDGVRVSLYRHMPYDLETMSPNSVKYMNNISDPRVLAFKSGGNSSLLYYMNTSNKQVSAQSGYRTLGAIGVLCNLSGMANSICDFDFINDNGVDVFYLWSGSVGELVLIITVLALIVIVVRGALGIVGAKGAGVTVSKMITTFLLSALLIGLIAIPDRVGQAITDIASSTMSFGTKVFNNDEFFGEFYTDSANESEKTQLRYWMLYFNAWSSYATGHAFNEDAAKFDTSQNTNEYTNGFDRSTAKLQGDKRINNWSAIMLESTFYHSLDSYRAIDHYLAPHVIPNGKEFTVENNQFYNNYLPFSKPPVEALAIALAVLIVTLIKLMCFAELVVDIILFMLKLAIGAIEGTSKIGGVFKQLGIDLLKVVVYEIVIVALIYFSFKIKPSVTTEDNAASLFISLIILAIPIAMVYTFITKPGFILAPNLLNSAHNVIYKFASSNAAIKSMMEANKASKNQLSEIDELNYGLTGKKTMRMRRNEIKEEFKNTASEAKDEWSSVTKEYKPTKNNFRKPKNKSGGRHG